MLKNILIFLLVIFLTGCGTKTDILNLDSKGKTIVCFGNSITKGVDTEERSDFPSLLSKKISLPVINAGVGGDTTQDALLRLKEVLAKEPKIVLVEFGANDFFQKIPKAETLKNLDGIVKRLQQKGVIVVLLHIRLGMLDEYISGFKKIAKKRKALLVKDILKDIIDNPSLKIDSIHPNAEGNKVLAERIFKEIGFLLAEAKQ